MWRKVGGPVLPVANSDTMYEHVPKPIPWLLNAEFHEQRTASLELVRDAVRRDTTSRPALKSILRERRDGRKEMQHHVEMDGACAVLVGELDTTPVLVRP